MNISPNDKDNTTISCEIKYHSRYADRFSSNDVLQFTTRIIIKRFAWYSTRACYKYDNMIE